MFPLTTPYHAHMSGLLGYLSLPELVGSLVLHHKSCMIYVESGLWHGFLYLSAGQILHARMVMPEHPDSELVGDRAAKELITWTRGFFLVDFDQVPPAITVTLSPEFLLLSTMVEVDEAAAMESQDLLDADTEMPSTPEAGASEPNNLPPATSAPRRSRRAAPRTSVADATTTLPAPRPPASHRGRKYVGA